MENKEKRKLLAVIVLAYLALLIANLMGLTGVWEYAKNTYTAIAYLGIAVLVWKNLDQLDRFHIDRLSLWLFALSGSFLRRRGGLAGELYFLPIIWLSSILVFVVLLWRSRNVPKTKLDWVIWGFLLACLALIPIALVESLNLEYWILVNPFYKSIPITLLRAVLSNLSFVSPLEEILYRGFLWGYLQDLGLEERKAAWTQGIMFWASHLGRIITAPVTFFFTIPLSTFLVTYLVYRSKQTAPSIIAHTTINSLLPSIMNLFFA